MAIQKITTDIIEDNAVTGSKISIGTPAAGDILYYNGTDYVKLAVGTDGQVLTLASGLPSWSDSGSGSGSGSGVTIPGGATVGNFQVHVFLQSASFTVQGEGQVDILMVGGGGGGAYGGGGAGGFRQLTNINLGIHSENTYWVEIGAGGLGSHASGWGDSTSGSDTYLAIGNSGGQQLYNSAGGGGQDVGTNEGADGGSGGGGAAGALGGSGNVPSVSPSQGSDGGTGAAGGEGASGGGGGGAAGVGLASQGAYGPGGAGGAGADNNYRTGSFQTYAGGGGGAAWTGAELGGGGTGGTGGAGGGGNGGNGLNAGGTNGAVNTGGGAGGHSFGVMRPNGNGGSGIVVIRYPI